MNYKFIPQKHFLKEIKRLAKKYRSLKQDLQALQDELERNPLAGVDLGAVCANCVWPSEARTEVKAMERAS